MNQTDEKTFQIEGMTCRSCELTVSEEVEELAFVQSASADHASGRLVVRGEQVDEEAVRDAVAASGYTVAA
jgi:copper chaperone